MVEIINGKDWTQMTHFEYLESIGQATIFDFLDAPVAPVKVFAIGAQVKVHYYDDELEYVQSYLPHLLEVGEIVEVHDGFCRVLHAGKATLMDNEKLVLI